jgi:type I restriction enzyme S subunit
LLSFKKDQEVETLGNIANYRRGSFPQPYGERKWYDGEGAMPFVQVADVGKDMRLVDDTKRKISKLGQEKSVFVPEGTVLVTLQGSIGRVAITQYDTYVDRTLAIFKSFKTDIDKKYFAYQLQKKFHLERESARGSTIKTITKEEFTKFEIPVPPLSEQKRIVSILDKFDALVNDISIGLPAEIKARKQQYEYYRNKLLTFPELETSDKVKK